MSDPKPSRSKKSAAISSVYAAIFLTLFKTIVGLTSGSLGILAEAAHSALDLVAALVTWFSVTFADKPADKNHPYGHGKVENLGALVETLLLVLTCVWILWEAGQRLFVRMGEVDASVWAFLVMIISIIVDISRSRMLKKAAIEHRSQALEADALHFQTDVWSSAVVIFGLIGVKLSDAYPALDELHHADAIAASIVALIAIGISIQLGKRTLMALVDSAPQGMAEQIQKLVEQIPGVMDCHNLRLRTSGATVFADLHVLMDGNLTLNEAHRLTEVIEDAVKASLPHCDLTVHPEPADQNTKN